MSKLYKNRSIIMVAVAAIIIIVIIAVTSMDRLQVSGPENLIGVLIKPVAGSVTSVVNAIRNSITGLAEIGSLKETNKMLNQQIITLRAQIREVEALIQENERLREMLYFKDTHSEFDLIGCSVIGKSPENTSSVFIINKGLENGIIRNMPVVNSKGLVGQVIEVGSGLAKVMPFNDQRSSVSILVNRTRDTGILKGDISFDITGSISPEAAIVEGDDIVTSGMGGIYPKGLYVGKITGISIGDRQLLKSIKVEPAVDFDKLEEVFVLKHVEELPSRGETMD
ncbi:MAG: rod shape-determining protein MreC [Firmicutes bacterium]|nr:rod shape-determining protein MreC [Bacillota bacterium]